ncbi:MAG TPA: tRNA (adenosine(37)-N6)-threonylcarbamoyltransferase complex transferase subunit TsaD [Victivallales bacterium]|nr:tRNA (adenosine(37)-N6)-threonylcarbamoyltransferase complex transferase subunit TsaD [Victivallales bacterium]HRR06383.1 tRNA (adenosine(37)-N6)-threonylcarbamoyltransferase complex transferase subunit TsaD [Victivallales bacterium]HRR28165.1 tRNA (adenosine(37)-N6)-threonylcarbamoyltransferase complex transferase subunit TsaD [Victivallales bacterium]HRU00269.1 tRNA (adenosine(37)-N6)-threonylcarbamoyltransferase complex transferase subunit TsaD [Victivallales bacterium]
MALILGIETSCDETSASVVENGNFVLSNIVYSQITKHSEFGGVVPELAAREHLQSIEVVVQEALSQASVSIFDIDAIAVTNGPGLVPALLIGLNFARALSFSYKLPLIPVNHFTAHIYGAFLPDKMNFLKKNSNFPMLALVVSGGHTVLLLIDKSKSVRIIGQTLDDAAGEAFDKGAKILGLGYPGGPAIEKAAKYGNPSKFIFPRALTGASGRAVDEEDRFNFSFSGLKTAILNHSRKNHHIMYDTNFIADTAASYQEAIVDVLIRKTLDAAKFYSVSTLILSGGVACNSRLRDKFIALKQQGYNIIIAEREFCTDNAAMIAGEAYHLLKNYTASYDFDIFARLPENKLKISFI